MTTSIWAAVAAVALLALLYKRAGVLLTTLVMAGVTVGSYFTQAHIGLWASLAVLSGVLGVFCIPALRSNIFTRPIFNIYKNIMPKMSDTEQAAIDAGSVGWDGELFAGKPNWKRLMDLPAPVLSEKEQSFLDNECAELAGMIDSWKIDQEDADLPPEMWAHLRKNKFFGMIIPEKDGGLEFSAYAQSAVLQVSTANSSVMSTIGVPNSLGPGELIHKYGTKEQQEYYLPRLADGREVPCFGLTGPRAGSDATSLPDTGVVCKGMYNGKEVVGIKLNFSKRYITLAPVATVIGLAFRMFDPEGLLGKQNDIGITVALIPRDTENLDIGRRHAPTGSPFMNGPIVGKDVFVPVDFIIGGAEMAGQGWRMLVECLSVGRCITLPSGGTGGAKYAVATTGAYARIRRQFNVAVSDLEGVQDPLARIAANSYIATASVSNTCAMIDQGEVPSVPSAILKYHLTELGRDVAVDSMDVHGGRGVCMGPKNYVGRSYQSVPVAITVEGANIMTRSLMIFGQGAFRCHPYVLPEIQAAKTNNLKEFDKALMGHFGFIFSNTVRSLVLSLTGSKLTSSPVSGPTAKYYKRVNRYAAILALLTDSAMFSMGGALKFKELISARLGDLLSNMYLITMVLKHWENQGRQKEDLPLVDFACQELFTRYEESLDGVLKNLPARPLAFILRRLVLPYGITARKPSDKLVAKVAGLITADTEARSRLIDGIYQGEKVGGGMDNPVYVYNQMLKDVERAQPLYKKISKAVKKDIVDADLLHIEERIAKCEELGVLTKEEAAFMTEFEARVLDMINVDDFPFDALGTKGKSIEENHKNLAA